MVGLLTAGAGFRESVAVWSPSGRVLVDASDLITAVILRCDTLASSEVNP
jgi:hypothetical protein